MIMKKFGIALAGLAFSATAAFAQQAAFKPADHLRHRRQVRQVLQRGRLQRRRAVQEGDRHRPIANSRSQRHPARAGAAPLRPRGTRRSSPSASPCRRAREGRQGVPEHEVRHHRLGRRAAQRRSPIVFKEHEGSLPGRHAGGHGLQDRQGRLRRRHGHPADPQLRLRLRAGRQVRQSRSRGDPEHDRHHAAPPGTIPAGRRARQGQFDRGADVVYAAAGGTGHRRAAGGGRRGKLASASTPTRTTCIPARC